MLENKNTKKPQRILWNIWNCYNAVINICAKFYGLVKKGKYQEEWNGLGLSVGMMLGVLAYVVTDEAAYIGLGLPLGLLIGWAVAVFGTEKQ